MAIHSAKNTYVKMSDGTSPGVFTTLGQVRPITGASVTTTIQDVTTHSTLGNWTESLATLVSGGTLDFDVNYDSADATHQFTTGLWNLMINLTEREYQEVFPVSIGQLQFLAYVASHSFGAPVDNVLSASISLAVNGAITATN